MSNLLGIPFQKTVSAVIDEFYQTNLEPHIVTPRRISKRETIEGRVAHGIVNDCPIASVNEELEGNIDMKKGSSEITRNDFPRIQAKTAALTVDLQDH